MHPLLSLLLSSMPGPLEAISLPHDASEHGARIDEIIQSTTVFVSLLLVLTVIWMLWSVIKHGPAHPALYDPGDTFRSWRWTVLVAVLIFVVVDGDLLFHSTKFMHGIYFDFAGAEAKPGAIRVEINAHQWAWNARYPGPDGKFNTPDDVVVLNEIVLPQGAPVIFQVTSTDVIHGFNVPNMRMKVDAVPGTVTRMWFQPRDTGVFGIICAQHCGANHYKMRGTVTVLPRAEFNRWAQVTSVNAARAYDPKDLEAHWGWDWAEHSRLQ